MNYKAQTFIIAVLSLLVLPACKHSSSENISSSDIMRESHQLRLITLDPGHFHAALVQKRMYEALDNEVHVYAPEGKDVQLYLQKIDQYNRQPEEATEWVEKVYTGPDYLEKMLDDKAGDLVVLAGKNGRKIEYIQSSIESGLHVLADKPMVIHPDGYPKLEEAFEMAEEKGLILYDIMTERYAIINIIQRELLLMENLFGELEKGTPDNPAISKESVHHFYKNVSGTPLIRPAWYFDVAQQGEGIIDVSTHFVDLILWSCFPDQMVAREEVAVVQAHRWPTPITPTQFEQVTALSEYPEYLQKDIVNDSVLNVFSNGEFVFQVGGTFAKVSVSWNYQAPERGGDTHLSMMRGSKAKLVIRQNKAQDYQPVLYIESANTAQPLSEEVINNAIEKIGQTYPGVTYKKSREGWEVVIPETYKTGHEAHFSIVMQKYLEFIHHGKLPEWERDILLSKYYITTQAYAKSHM